ncbi:MBL fold metallo-hydrolase [Gordonia sp. PKS22-38]|uniref:MBL fold metallo-hydrolase n=1 Tax=Gordonia prachuapensis TaxID=3115651 RepID=A0ABU7MTP7_9ACTN|nr:MBL fold metallo-hydrolase [Gordonia sp. PKS22-38]
MTGRGDDDAGDGDARGDSLAGRSRVRWLGHASTLITDGATTVLTDPILTARVAHLRRRRGPTPTDPAIRDPDVVLLSHLHADHTHLPSLRMISDDVPIVVPRRAPDVFPALKAVGGRLIEVTAGDEVEIGDLVIRAVPADHDGRRWRRGSFDTSALGYVITGELTTYFAGDTDLYPDLGTWVSECDLALLPVGGWGPNLGPGHMTPDRAAEAAGIVGATLAVPIHFGTLWPIGFDRIRPDRFYRPGAEFVSLLDRRGVTATELHPGETIGLDAV